LMGGLSNAIQWEVDQLQHGLHLLFIEI